MTVVHSRSLILTQTVSARTTCAVYTQTVILLFIYGVHGLANLQDTLMLFCALLHVFGAYAKPVIPHKQFIGTIHFTAVTSISRRERTRIDSIFVRYQTHFRYKPESHRIPVN